MKIQILKAGIVTNEATFETQEELNSWLEIHKAAGSFGKNESKEVKEISSAVINEDGSIAVEAINEEVTVAADYVVLITDESTKLEQEKINEEALAYLQATDYLVIRALEDASKPVSEEIKQARQAARLKVVR